MSSLFDLIFLIGLIVFLYWVMPYVFLACGVLFLLFCTGYVFAALMDIVGGLFKRKPKTASA